MIAVFDPTSTSSRLQRLANSLDLPYIDREQPSAQSSYSLLLMEDAAGLAIQQTGKRAPGPVRADFLQGKAAYRRRRGGGELIVKAIGGRPGLSVVDATAGLGRDAFILATHGYRVTLVERAPVVVALLRDALQRAGRCEDGALSAIAARMDLVQAESVPYLQALIPAPDAVYLDPMFPASGKSALAKKEMRLFQQLLDEEQDESALLGAARAAARYRVVVKRPLKAQPLAGVAADFSVAGKAVRYDVYARRSYKHKQL